MKKYTFYTNKKIVFMLSAVLILNIVQVMLDINTEFIFFLTNIILSSIVMISVISVLLYNTVLKISLDDICLTKGFIFKKNIYWNSISAIQRREEHFIIYYQQNRIVINLNILRNNPSKYRELFKLMANYLDDSTEIDDESQRLLGR